MVKLVLDIRKSVEGNAAVYFEKAKKARKKLEGAKAALDRTQRKLRQLTSEKEASDREYMAASAERKAVATMKQGREWYEKFRWFTSSEGFLCVGGRDATTNEIIIKKHTDGNDLVFHTELAGSPFFVVKSSSMTLLGKAQVGLRRLGPVEIASTWGSIQNGSTKEIGSATVEEAATATASYSRAWKAGLQSVDVYYVKPGQVSKEAKAGEYLTKGAFMIYGRKTPVPARVGLAIGVLPDGKIMGGPAAAVSASCSKYVKLTQGDVKPSDAAKKIAKILGLSSSYLDEIIRAMPAGEFKVVMA